MATIVTKGGGIGSLLGGLATIGGALTGTPWLSALGTGIGMANGMMNGGGAAGGAMSGVTSMKDLLDQINGWINPASGSLVNTSKSISNTANKVMNNAQTNNNWQKALAYANQNPYNGGGNLWQW